MKVENLHTSFFTDAGEVKAVRGVSFSLAQGKTLGLVGESGCGKTTVALSLIRLLPFPGRMVKGAVIYKGKDLAILDDSDIQKIRGKEIAMVFQEPMTALNPVFTIGEQIREVIQLHQGVDRGQAIQRAVVLLEQVGMPSPQTRIKAYPHQLSGGMRQRVLIAMAISCNPGFLIADEPTTALDVTIQAQLLELIKKLQKELGLAMLLITHDLGVVAECADEVAVMYSGKIVEYASCKTLFEKPLHPYTCGLLASIPRIEDSVKKPLKPISGTVGNLLCPPKGCTFKERCPRAFEKCEDREPELAEVEKGHWASCYL